MQRRQKRRAIVLKFKKKKASERPLRINSKKKKKKNSTSTPRPRPPRRSPLCFFSPFLVPPHLPPLSRTYADAVGPENAAKYQTLVFLAGSASAEFFADIGLCPFEAVKVKVQTVPGFARGLSDGMPKFIATEGIGGLYKGLTPLWGRQIPYTMMKFAAFENTVMVSRRRKRKKKRKKRNREKNDRRKKNRKLKKKTLSFKKKKKLLQALYKYVVPKPKSECSKQEQLAVSFAAGYIAGVFCAVVSHPADNLVSKLNANKGVSAGEIVKEMGWVALMTRGLPLRIIMIGTLTGLQWGIYDAFKVAVGLPTTGSAAPPAK